MSDRTISYIGLGSNEGNRQQFIESARKAMSHTEGLTVLRTSRVIETKSLSRNPQQDYLNAVAQVETALPPAELLKQLQSIENQLGRVRTEKWGSRTIDLDVLLYGDSVIEQPGLSIPHRQLHLRSFILNGLCELCPDRLHPVMKVSFSELLGRLNGGDFMLDGARPQLISIAGPIGVGKSTLAKGLLKYISANGIFEEYDKNPYLSKVYAGRKELALDSELYFLTSSVSQLSPDSLAAGRVYIGDYVFDKALMYAQCWLEPEALQKYEAVFAQQRQKVVSPVLIISIEDSTEHCIERIHLRNRRYEQQIETGFLKHQQMWYNTFCQNWKNSPLIRIPADQCRTDPQVQKLADQIRHYLPSKQEIRCNCLKP
jgi:2-amino-4-hydroxy-6-hydroxymethyldihydropteridine diphosphokinase